ncbi:NAD(P)(+)-binding proteins & short chain dehydrogenase [Metarhizium guizhouense ARSEF 977]|uniref:NAD(P)(+)-binding proteins & short chain dehydrogenase n=1 Tax=Metarhizium guizhouense (strain ARSEF 977) TaxID=1276136 RepID=A0A0B4G528_METGA|nr:NAD(P)(+)-binding proteins & short chain dehydrogenase [Metarhizium guizhouense ARSEF 977]
MVHQSSRTIVVTGASRGLGLSESTENFVIAVVRDAKKAQQSETLSRSNVAIVTADLSKLETFPVVAAEISRLSGGKVDILINNAGVMIGAGASFDQGISKSTPGEWDGQVRLFPIQASKEKKVVNLASMLGDLSYTFANPDLHFASYAATKAALTMATAKFHNEFKNKGFTFLALNPGWVNTDLAGEGKGTIVNTMLLLFGAAGDRANATL